MNGFRLARLSDIPRIGLVAAAAFYHSPVFQYQRPDHDKYSYDTLASYRAEFASAILDPLSVVLVKETKHNNSESGSVYEALANIYPDLGAAVSPDDSGNIIIAVASFIFKTGSPRKGQFQPEGTSFHHFLHICKFDYN
jgi:hypothetical protein